MDIRNEDRIIATSAYLDKLNNANNAMTVDQTRPQPHYVSGKSLTDIWAVNSLGIDPATGKEKFLKANGTETFTWMQLIKFLPVICHLTGWVRSEQVYQLKISPPVFISITSLVQNITIKHWQTDWRMLISPIT
jgi:hypothetical protein